MILPLVLDILLKQIHYHHYQHYHHLVQPFEAAARLIRQDMVALLRRRARANDDEATMWYTDQERIAKRVHSGLASSTGRIPQRRMCVSCL